jgi:hypothetical protein
LLAAVSNYDVERWQREFLAALRSNDGSAHDLQNMPQTLRSRSAKPAEFYPSGTGGLG